MENSPDELAPTKRFIPFVTIALAAANVIVYAISIAMGADALAPSPQKIFDLGGNFGPVTLDGEPWRLFTSMFLHYGALHIAMNMIGLVDGGRTVERWYGHAGFAALYVFSGLAGSLLSATQGAAISAGASGAIFGVFGAFGAFLILRKDTLDRALVAKQSRGLVAFLAYSVIFGLQAKGIDMRAHIGGLAAGFVAGLLLEAGKRAGAQRVARALLIGVLGSAAIAGAAMAVKPPEAEAWLESSKAAFDRFAELESKAIDGYNKIVTTENLSYPDAVKILDAEVIPAWQAAEAVVAGVRSAPAGLDQVLPTYWRARMDALVALREGLVTEDDAAIKQAVEKFQAAGELLKQLEP